jgi:hypothetical protein
VREYPEAPFINQRLDEWEKLITAVFNEFDPFIVPTKIMDVSFLPAGIYIVKVYANKRVVTKKIRINNV